MIQWLLFPLCVNALYADIEDYFKKVGDKSGFHQMRNIDFIYMINLDQRPEKLESCRQQLAPLGIHPCRFAAINGWEMPLEAAAELGVKYESWMSGGSPGTTFLPDAGGKPLDETIQMEGRTYYCHGMTLGAIGCVLSHLSILQDAYDSGFETIWIMEDDIEIIRDPFMLSGLIEELDHLVGKENWDVLFTDQNTKDKQGNYVYCSGHRWRPNFSPVNPRKFIERTIISADFRRIGARYGSYSMIVRRSGMTKLLDFMKQYKIFLPYDMEYTLPPDIQLFTTTYDIVSTQPRAPSDNAFPEYENPKSDPSEKAQE